ncbi:hypothetical protein BJV82DRAFT_148251, partial [Fennellomyces sp. T-0311]
LLTYLDQIATQPCHSRHPTLSTTTIHYLFRNLNDYSKRTKSQAISEHIQKIMALI